MLVKHSLYVAGLALPLLLAAAAPSMATGSQATVQEDAVIDETNAMADESTVGTDEGDVTMDEQMIEPVAAEPESAGCVKTNVKNFKNACPQ